MRFFSRCTWIRSEPGDIAKAADRRVEVAVFLLQARQLLAQLAFVGLRHRHRWFALPPARPAKPANYRVFHKPVQAPRNARPIKDFAADCGAAKPGVPSLLR